MSDDPNQANGDDTLTEEEAFEMALDDHPELKRLYLDDKLPEEMRDGQGNVWSPMSHLALHAQLEFQIANDQPRGMAEAASQLEQAGIDHHETRHLLAEVVANEIWESMQEGNEDEIDNARLMKEVHKVVRGVTTPE